MKLRLLRYSDNGDSTLGLLFINGLFAAHSLEDEYRKDKIQGETRIPAGRYQIKYREVESKMTVKYRGRYIFFTWHLELQDVPGFSNIYLHIGNTDEDSMGCILIGDSANNNQIVKGFISSSVNCFKRVYQEITDAIDHGEEITIEVIND